MKIFFLSVAVLSVVPRCSAGGLLIPLYSWPDIAANGAGYDCVDPDYTKVATSAAEDKTIAIVNPDSGPDCGGDAWKKLSYDTCISYLRSNGVEVVGYVHTKLGWPGPLTAYRPMADVTNDVDKWLTEYTVDGIFVDEMTNRWPDLAWDSEETAITFYQSVVDYIFDKDASLHVILNPGSVYFESILEPYYGNSQVIAVVFESMQWNYQRGNCIWSLWTDQKGSFDQGPFCNYVPEWDNVEPLMDAMMSDTISRDQSAVMIYGANPSAEDTAESFVHGLSHNVGWYYITDRWDWAATPGDVVWNEQVANALAL